MKKAVVCFIMVFLFSKHSFSAEPSVYIVSIPGVAASYLTSITDVKNGAADAANVRRLSVTVINTLAGWVNLVTNPPNNAIVLNAHGEVIPWDGSTLGSISAFLQKIASNVIYNSWRFVNISGYPFYYWASGGTRNQIGTSGLSTFLQVAGYNATAYTGTDTGYKLFLGEKAEKPFGVTFPSSANFSRPLTFSSGHPEYIFYAGDYESICAKIMGGGAYVNVDGSPFSDYNKGYMGIVFAYATFSPYPETYYLIRIPGVNGGWADPQTVENGVVEALTKIKDDVNLIKVNSLVRLQRLVDFSPPYDVTVINAHGEYIPWDGWWRGAGNDTDGCLNWIDLIGTRTAGWGWEFVNLSGYPFYYCIKTNNTTVTVGGSGLTRFFSKVGRSVSIDGTSKNYTKQAIAGYAEYPFGYAFPTLLSGQRGIQTSVFCSFYNDLNVSHLAAKINFGSGIYLHIDGSGLGDLDKGRMAVAFSHYICQKAGRLAEIESGGGCSCKNVTDKKPYIFNGLIFAFLLLLFTIPLRRLYKTL
jgi:hypothetical protein